MKKDIDAFQDMLARMDRHETVLGIKLDRLTEFEQAIVKWQKALTLEVEQLKALKHSLETALPEKVYSSIKESADVIIPQLLPRIVEGFQEQTQEGIKSCIDEAQRIKKGIDDSISEANRFMSAQKRDMTLQRLGMTFFFCLGSFVTAISIFYYFPQHEHVTYKLGLDTARAAVIGKALIENEAKLTPEQHKFFIKKIEEELKIKNNP
jgi:hypothetical protein